MVKKMRILILNYEFPPLGGGAGRATLNIAKELVKQGHQVDIITSKYNDHTPRKDSKATIYSVNTHRKSIHDVGLLAIVEYLVKGWFIYRKLVKKNDYDAIHAFFSIPTGIITYLGKKLYGKKYIVSLRGSDVPGYDPDMFPILQKMLIGLNRKIWKNAETVVANSNGLKKIAEQTEKMRFGVIHNAANTDLFKPANKKKQGKTLRLVTVCRILKRKGLQHVIQALKQIEQEDITLDIYGTGEYEEELKELVKEKQLQRKVLFHGFKPSKEIAKKLNEADVFIHPSLTEAFGMVFAEAMACGLPIIATRVGGIPEIVEDGKNGFLVKPGDVQGLKKAIQKLKGNPTLMKQMGKDSLKKVKERFSWEKVAQAYLKEYQKANQGKRSR
jgi:glycosyltransferase involved in cell wall biosynthesis